MHVVMIRTNGVNPDPRVEKEVNSIIKNGDHTVTVLAWDRDNDKDSKDYLYLSNGQAKIVRFGIPSEWGGGFKKNLAPLIKFSIKVHLWLKENENLYECIHACDLPTAMMATPYIKRKKFVYDIFDYFPDTAHAPRLVLNYARKKEKQMIEMADATIICSEQRKKQIGNAKPKNLIVIHNSPDSRLLNDIDATNRTIIKSNRKATKIVYVGNLIRERYIDVIAEVIADMKGIEFHVGGIGPLDEFLLTMSKEHDNIYYYGRMQYIDVISLEKQCDILLALYDPSVPNNNYAAPNKFYEALLVGKPLIMIKNTGMDKLVEIEKLGCVAPKPDKKSLEDAILQAEHLIKNDSHISERMKTVYANQFSWNIMEERLRDLYANI